MQFSQKMNVIERIFLKNIGNYEPWRNQLWELSAEFFEKLWDNRINEDKLGIPILRLKIVWFQEIEKLIKNQEEKYLYLDERPLKPHEKANPLFANDSTISDYFLLEGSVNELMGRTPFFPNLILAIQTEDNHSVQELVKELNREREQLESNYKAATNELAAAHSIIKRQKEKIAAKEKHKDNPTREELWKLADKCRFKNGQQKINFTKLGKQLGVSYHKAQRLCNDFGVRQN